MISSHWTIKDYVDDSGTNLILEWVRGIPDKKARQRFVTLLRNIENTPPPLKREHKVATLSHDCEGLLEIIFEVKKVQYRPIGFYGPGEREITLLVGATKKSRGKRNQSEFDPSNACSLGQRRKQEVLKDHKRAVDHDYRTT